MIRFRFALPARTALFALALLASTCSVQANLVWDAHLVDEQAIANGSSISAGGTTITLTTTVFSDSDGGTFDLSPALNRNPAYVAYEAGLNGNQLGNLELAFDNQNDDPADYVQIKMDFAPAVTELELSILDLDGSPIRYWDDGIEIYSNGTNVRTNPSMYTIGSAVFLDNESYMYGFEGGSTSASSTQTSGNVDLNFGATPISSVTVKYFSTDDARPNPSPQFVGISDLAYTIISEPKAGLPMLCVLLSAMFLYRRR